MPRPRKRRSVCYFPQTLAFAPVEQLSLVSLRLEPCRVGALHRYEMAAAPVERFVYITRGEVCFFLREGQLQAGSRDMVYLPRDTAYRSQWFREAAEEDIALAKAYLGLNLEEGYVWGMIRGCMSAISKLSIVQMQDYLELGGEARMNFPGTLSGNNWSWRAKDGSFTPELAERILKITKLYDRI